MSLTSNMGTFRTGWDRTRAGLHSPIFWGMDVSISGAAGFVWQSWITGAIVAISMFIALWIGATAAVPTQELRRRQPMAIVISGVIIICVGVLLLAWGLIAVQPKSTLSEDQKATLGRIGAISASVEELVRNTDQIATQANKINDVLLSRQRLKRVKEVLNNKSFDPDSYDFEDRRDSLNTRERVLRVDEMSWLSDYDSLTDRRTEILRRESILPDSKMTQEKFKHELRALESHLRAVKVKLTQRSRFPDPGRD